jgi:catechol 2,3-dioxygenase-like lactoylglutathione lyase family enzyme
MGTPIDADGQRAVRGLDHVNLLVSDLAAARQFYGGALGLAELDRPVAIGEGAWFDLGNTQLHLSVVGATAAAATNAHIALRLPPGAFDEIVASMVQRGLELTREPRSREQLGVEVRTAFCRDPSGNLIELTDAGAG